MGGIFAEEWKCRRSRLADLLKSANGAEQAPFETLACRDEIHHATVVRGPRRCRPARSLPVIRLCATSSVREEADVKLLHVPGYFTYQCPDTETPGPPRLRPANDVRTQ